jgi:hypothetical protein
MMKTQVKICIEIGLAAVAAFAATTRAETPLSAVASAQTAPIHGSRACKSGESWQLDGAIPASYISRFHDFLGKTIPAVRGFSEALALRRQAQSAEQKYFAEYWVSRSLYGSKMVHISKQGFTVLASRPVTSSTVGIQLAALECLTQIHDRFPAIEIPVSVIHRLPEYVSAVSAKNALQPVWDVATIRELTLLGRGEKATKAESDRLLSLLAKSGSHEALIRGMLAAHHGDHSTVIQELRKFISQPIPPTLERYKDTAIIELARSYYSLGQYENAIAQFKNVSKSSNKLAMALEELSWAYLMSEKYREAIGTAMSLQAGGLRMTFAPEAPMVMSMAMNEICQFPDSLNAANLFRKNYETSFKWLDHWRANGRSDNLYKRAVQYLRKQGNTPVRVASEWVRSPLFLSNQDEINLLFDERDAASALTKFGSKEQNRLGLEILNNIKTLKPAFYAARAKLKPGQELPKEIREGLQKLKEDVIAFRRMQRAAPIWKAVLANHQKQAPGIEKKLTADIESDLKIRTDRMLTQLQEFA